MLLFKIQLIVKHILLILCMFTMLISCSKKDTNEEIEIDYSIVTSRVIGQVNKWANAINSKDFDVALALTKNVENTHLLNCTCSIEDPTKLKIEFSSLTKQSSSNVKDGIIVLSGDLKITINQNDDEKYFLHKINVSLLCSEDKFTASNWKITSLELKN